MGGKGWDAGVNLPTVSDFIGKKKTMKTKTSLLKKLPLRRLFPCSEMFHVKVDMDPVHNATAMRGTKASSVSQTELFFFCKCEAAVWGVPRQVRLSACLDRVSELDMALTVHFLMVLEMNPGDLCLSKGRVSITPGLFFWVLSCLENRTVGPF